MLFIINTTLNPTGVEQLTVNRLTYGLSIMILLMAVISFIPLLRPPLPLMIVLLSLYVVFLFVFCFIHGVQTLEIRAISMFFVISAAITYLMEWLGTQYGVPFGSYYYTYKIGPLLFGVPFVIPIQWFNMLYICYIMTQAIFIRLSAINDNVRNDTSITQSIIVASVTGLFMVAWDLINDPFMVGLGAWVWTDPLWFFGLSFQEVPLSNFIGWELTSILAILLFEMYRHRSHASIHWSSGECKSLNLLVMFPYVLAYLSQAVQGVMFGIFPLSDMTGLIPLIVAGVTMGLGSLLSATSLVRMGDESESV